MTIFLLSESFKNIYKNDKKIGCEVDKSNKFEENLTKMLKKCDNFLFICNNPKNFWHGRRNAKLMFKGLSNANLPFKKYKVLSNFTKKNSTKLIKEADLIFIQGGKLEGQLDFLNEINFNENIKSSSAVICGKSAGAMNLQKDVYQYPEEVSEIGCKKWLKGLGMVDVVIIPHFNTENGNKYNFCNLNLIDEYFIPDSKGHKIYALEEGSYILSKDGKNLIYGNAYLFENGIMTKICEDEECKEI